MLEAQVGTISRIMAILMVSLEKKIGLFWKKPKSHEKPEYHEEPMKENEALNLEK